MKDDNGFSYTYSAKQQAEIENIRKKYLPKEEDKMEQLRKLDRSAHSPGITASLILGIVGCLVMGIGMCCCMVWADQWFIQGIVIGIIGMILIASAYPLYNVITQKKRKEIAPKILELTEELKKQ